MAYERFIKWTASTNFKDAIVVYATGYIDIGYRKLNETKRNTIKGFSKI